MLSTTPGPGFPKLWGTSDNSTGPVEGQKASPLGFFDGFSTIHRAYYDYYRL